MTSVQSRTSLPLPVLPASVLRARLEVIRGRLLELEDACPPGHVAGVADALEALEDELVTLGWQPPPLSDRDVEVLISLGCQP